MKKYLKCAGLIYKEFIHQSRCLIRTNTFDYIFNILMSIVLIVSGYVWMAIFALLFFQLIILGYSLRKLYLDYKKIKEINLNSPHHKNEDIDDKKF